MSIIASVFVIPLMYFASVGIAIIAFHHTPLHYSTAQLCLWSFQVLIGLVQAVIAITAAGYSCRALCCNDPAGGIVFYHPAAAGSSNSATITVIPPSAREIKSLPSAPVFCNPAADFSDSATIPLIPQQSPNHLFTS